MVCYRDEGEHCTGPSLFYLLSQTPQSLGESTTRDVSDISFVSFDDPRSLMHFKLFLECDSLEFYHLFSAYKDPNSIVD